MMVRSALASMLALAALLSACDRRIHIGSTTDAGGAADDVPEQLPPRLLIGLRDDDGTWMGASGVAWDVRWRYFAGGTDGAGWYNNWVSGGGLTGEWASAWFASVVSEGFIPAVQYWLLESDYEPVGSSGAEIMTAKLEVPSVMKDYFTKFRLLLRTAKEVPGPVIVILEANAMGAIEEQSGNDPSAYAAIADSGLPELAGLPNTVAGFGLALLTLRQSVGAGNVLMGPDVEQASSQSDFLFHSASDDIAPHVDYQYGSFLRHLGVGANQTGESFDFVAASPGYADADYLAVAEGDPGYWLDTSDDASVATQSYNRYAEWLKLFHRASDTPWILWQIPIGNSNSPNVDARRGAWAGPYPEDYVLPSGCTRGAATGCPSGYKDNRAEYFLGTERDEHLAKFAAAGVIGLLFGPSENCTDPSSDYYTDGQLFLQSRAGALLDAGGFPLSRAAARN
jgi:hypothetical protein